MGVRAQKKASHRTAQENFNPKDGREWLGELATLRTVLEQASKDTQGQDSQGAVWGREPFRDGYRFKLCLAPL